jgi:hypothetical protein
LFKVVKIFAIGVRVILYFRHGNYSMKRRSENRLIKMARYATITHPRGRGECSLWVLKMGGMWLSKVARRGEISNAISKNFVGYCVGCEDL